MHDGPDHLDDLGDAEDLGDAGDLGDLGRGASPSRSLPPEVMAAHDHAVAVGRDWYPDPATGFMVLTVEFLAARGECCGSGCRHCPYPQADG